MTLHLASPYKGSLADKGYAHLTQADVMVASDVFNGATSASFGSIHLVTICQLGVRIHSGSIQAVWLL